MKQPAVYILANKRNGTLYTGVTSNLMQRISQHKNKEIEGFTSRYNCTLLVYYELFGDMLGAIACEKKIKSMARVKKLALIEFKNPNWIDLYTQICD